MVAVVRGGLGYWVFSDVDASIGEHDFSKIGNGIPAVVQIHDSNCSVCRGLMRESREALEAFGKGEIQ